MQNNLYQDTLGLLHATDKDAHLPSRRLALQHNRGFALHGGGLHAEGGAVHHEAAGEALGEAPVAFDLCELVVAHARIVDGLAVHAAPEQIITTMGATHALDIVARTLLRPGDAVLVDEPGWAVEFARLTRMGMRLLPVPRNPPVKSCR